MNIIDTHCHLYLPEFDSDRNEAILRATDAGVTKFFLPNIDRSSIQDLLSLTFVNAGVCYPMMGLHPCSVKATYREEISTIEGYLFNHPDLKFYGIGETGLDLYWDKSFFHQQKENFQIHIEWSKQLHLPIIIHSRDALPDCIEMIELNKDEKLTGIFHCFSGTLEQAKRIIELGFFVGIGGVVTFKNSGLDIVMRDIDLSHVVLETDAPYLAPVPFRGKRNESSYIRFVIKKIAEIKNVSEEEVAAITSENAAKVFHVSL